MEAKNDIIYFQIAGFNIKISSNNKSFEKQNTYKNLQVYKNFILTKIPSTIDYEIEFTETEKFYSLNRKEKKLKASYNINLIQLQFILRTVLQELLTQYNSFILHASSNKIGNKACLFLGPNGAGKSTIMKLLADEYTPLADDSIIIKNEKRKYRLYQTPFLEKERSLSKSYRSYSIGKIFFLYKAGFTKTEKINNKIIITKKMLNQLYTDKERKQKQINYVIEFISNFNQFYYLYFPKNKKEVLRLFYFQL